MHQDEEFSHRNHISIPSINLLLRKANNSGDSLVNVLWSTVAMLNYAGCGGFGGCDGCDVCDGCDTCCCALALPIRHSQSGTPNQLCLIGRVGRVSDRKGVCSEGCWGSTSGSTFDGRWQYPRWPKGRRSDGSAAEVYIPAGRSQSGTPSQPFWSEGCLIGRVQCDGAMVVVC